MTSKQKVNWLKALRSDRYEQIEGALTNKRDVKKNKVKVLGYCCLGVAEVACKAIRANEGTLSQSFLPMEIQDKLIDFNDKKKWSFKRIAAYIERYVQPTK